MDDTVNLNVSTNPSTQQNLGAGDDTVNVSANAPGQVRVTFTSSEVGNGNPNDSGTMTNQDGGLAVRLQAETGSDGLTGPISRFDDEGISFVSATPGLTFDVRDLVSGTQRGDQFDVVRLGTQGIDVFDENGSTKNYYINAGMGNDRVTGGAGNDFLVGGAGNDRLDGGAGNDTFIGGARNDTIFGGDGDDRAIFNVSTDGGDRVDLGAGADVVSVSAAAPGQVRLMFTSSEVGNGNANDSNTMAKQDGGLAVRLYGEDGTTDRLTGSLLSRYDDEGITFVAAAGTTFDVRDLVSGTQRGDQFNVVSLGTSGIDVLAATLVSQNYYFNAGMGNDRVTGGDGNDFLVGGAGNDRLEGGNGNDTFIGGARNDAIFGGEGDDRAIFNVSTDGGDRVDLGAGADVVSVSAAAPGQVRLMFTSSEVGNGNANDSNTMTKQDGGLAVRLYGEDGTTDRLTGSLLSRYDDEGITFVAAAGTTFDVRDLVSGVQRGDQFNVVSLGTGGADNLTASQSANSSYYFNAGMGDDMVTGGNASDFLVGGAGNDTLDGGLGNDTFIGGGGSDVFAFSTALNAAANVDTINDFVAADDTIQLDSSVFRGLAMGTLDPNAFALSTDAGQADDLVIYNAQTGDLFFDANGGTRDDAIAFAKLATAPTITANDFFVV